MSHDDIPKWMRKWYVVGFGAMTWFWILYRFKQDYRVLLGFEHPWEHGHGHQKYNLEEYAFYEGDKLPDVNQRKLPHHH